MQFIIRFCSGGDLYATYTVCACVHIICCNIHTIARIITSVVGECSGSFVLTLCYTCWELTVVLCCIEIRF